MTTQRSLPPAPPPPEPSAGRAALVATGSFVIVALLAVGLIASTGRYLPDLDASGAPHNPAMAGMVAPDGVLDLAEANPVLAAEYRYAADHAETYAQLRCWCGCEEAFDHPSLLECFVRPDGGWEAHGAGCAVCLGEAATARTGMEADVPVADIAAELDATYGPASLPAATATPEETSP